MRTIAELSLPAFDMLWEDLALGAMPFPLEVRSHGDTASERARIKDAVYADLSRRELVGGGRPAEPLASALALLAAPPLAVDLVAMLDMDADELLRVVVAVAGANAVRAVQKALTVELMALPRDAVAQAVVELLPSERAGEGEEITVPVAVLSGEAVAPRVRSGGRHRAPGDQDDGWPELDLVEHVVARPALRAGTLGITAGGARLAGLTWFDNDLGRFVTTIEQARDGQQLACVAPADSAVLAGWVAEMLAADTE